MNYMKKTLLLAGVASLFAVNTANAEVKPYVGLDYTIPAMAWTNLTMMHLKTTITACLSLPVQN